MASSQVNIVIHLIIYQNLHLFYFLVENVFPKVHEEKCDSRLQITCTTGKFYFKKRIQPYHSTVFNLKVKMVKYWIQKSVLI